MALRQSSLLRCLLGEESFVPKSQETHCLTSRQQHKDEHFNQADKLWGAGERCGSYYKLQRRQKLSSNFAKVLLTFQHRLMGNLSFPGHRQEPSLCSHALHSWWLCRLGNSTCLWKEAKSSCKIGNPWHLWQQIKQRQLGVA